ncbi:MAG TPA: FAD-dependent oxidoreductase, partial [Nevskiaceae bacterium]|nr:FAD-dependent oxidoreductase [Nevskiaceae bacterium]
MIGTDVLIIGGGIAGASLGYALARPQDAVLLEAEDQPGYHSTGRSAALYMTTYGHPLIRALTHASRAFLERPPAGFAEVALMQLRGVLWIARADQQAAFARYYADCSALDRSVARCTVEQALALCPALQSAYVNQAFVEPSAQDMDVSA